MNLSVKFDELTEEEFAALWMRGVSYVERENPRLGYSGDEKKKGARIAIQMIVSDWLTSKLHPIPVD